MGVRFVNRECDYRQNWTTRRLKSCYQLIETITKSEKKINHRSSLNVLVNKVNSYVFFDRPRCMKIGTHSSPLNCPIKARVNDAYCPITQA